MRTNLLISLVACLIMAGCCQTPPPAGQSFHANPKETMARVVSGINANNQKIPTLWASLYYKADIRDQGRTHTVFGEGVLLYRAPMGMRLVGQKEFVGTVFEIGSTDTQYWLQVKPELNTLWIGRYADLAHVDIDRLPIPIRPDLVLSVLGIESIDTNFNALPAPTMRYNNEQDVYMFVWNAKAPDRWVAQKEIWYDRATRRPRRVLLYDGNGRTVLRADLSMQRAVQLYDVPQKDWPVMPGDYKLFFPDTGSRMEFTINEARITAREGALPNIHPPDVEGTDVKVIQIGAGAGV
jgi:hypothetical protein